MFNVQKLKAIDNTLRKRRVPIRCSMGVHRVNRSRSYNYRDPHLATPGPPQAPMLVLYAAVLHDRCLPNRKLPGFCVQFPISNAIRVGVETDGDDGCVEEEKRHEEEPIPARGLEHSPLYTRPLEQVKKRLWGSVFEGASIAAIAYVARKAKVETKNAIDDDNTGAGQHPKGMRWTRRISLGNFSCMPNTVVLDIKNRCHTTNDELGDKPVTVAASQPWFNCKADRL